MKRTALSILLILSTIFTQAQTTLRILAIGNSFSEDAVEQYLYELGHEAGYNLIIGNAYRGGQGLESQWNVIRQGKPDFQFRKITDGKRTNRKGVVIDSILANEPWDIITFQQVSQDAGLPKTYEPYLQSLLQYVKTRVGKNVRYGLQQTWAYAQDATHQGFANYEGNQTNMYEQVVAAVRTATQRHTDLTLCIPSGTAIQNMRNSIIGDHLCRDGYHLDRILGRYITACTWLEALTGHSSVGLKTRPKNLRRELAAVAQQAAHNAVLMPESITPLPQSTEIIDTCRISVFGSSVAHGTGAHEEHGYAYFYGQQLQQRKQSGTSPYPFTISDISVGGNTTTDLLNRYHDLIYDLGRYVVIAVSLGNEGIHNAKNRQGTFEKWRDNVLWLVEKVRVDGKVPVVTNNYGRADFTPEDYAYVRRLNLLIHQWDVPSVNLLGAVDDGSGHWAKGYESDANHPNTQGHREMMYSIPPSLFDALAQGKTLPTRNMEDDATLSRGNTIRFKPEGTTHPFTISLTVKGSDRGRIATLNARGRQAWLGVNKDHRVYYCSTTGDSLVCPIPLTDNVRHTITLSHRYAQRRTLFYVDTEGQELDERLQLESVVVGDASSKGVKRHFSEIFFWRSALNGDEITAHARGNLLKSSLEIYASLSDENKKAPVNQAQSMNTLRYVTHRNADTKNKR